MIKKLLLLLFLATFSISSAQESYYSDVDLTLSGTALKDALATKVIATHTTMLSYTPGVWEASKITDANPANSSEVVLIYGWEDRSDQDDTNDATRDNTLKDNGSNGSFVWNREHVYAKSLGDPNLQTTGPGADAHNLRPADRTTNTVRSNRKFGDGTGYSGSSSDNASNWYPGDKWKGDVARMMMYMYVRYGDQCLPSAVGVGDSQFTPDDMIDLFLVWNVEDPISDFEKGRNTFHENTSNTYAQGNRNPFIDNAYLATRIWGGDAAADSWGIYIGSDEEAPSTPTNVVASNNMASSIELNWTASTDNVEVVGYNIYIDGALNTQTANSTATITSLTPNTSYSFEVEARDMINKSAKSAAITSATIQDIEAPSVPAALVVSQETDSSFKITWEASSDNVAVTSYEIYLDGALSTSTTDLDHTFTGLTTSTSYTASVSAKDGKNNQSAQTTSVNATTTDGSSNGINALFISEYVEGGGNNKAIEIANLSSATISLTGYTLKKQSNGGGDWINEFDLSNGSVKNVTPGDVFVVINGQSDDATLLAEVDLTVPNDGSYPYGAPVNFNGNDALGLFQDDVLIDIVGVLNETSKNFADQTLRRKSAVHEGNTLYAYSEWNAYPKDNTEDIGRHTSTAGTEGFIFESFKMFPNPVNGNKIYFSVTQEAKIAIYNVLGKLIKTATLTKRNNTIDLTGFSKGVYLVKINLGPQFITKKLIKN
jgi:endonuclease I/chitodextrinase